MKRSMAGITCTSNGKIFPQSIQRQSRVLEIQKAQTRHTAVTATSSCARHWFASKKPSSVLGGAQTNGLGIVNHKNNQHAHLNPNKPICTEPVKSPLRASVIPYIWFTFFKEIIEAVQLVPKAQREGENPQDTYVASLQQHEPKQMEKPKIGCDSLSLISMNYLAECSIFQCNLVAPFPKN